MAMIRCEKCNELISDKSTNCVHCGYPVKSNHRICKECGNIIGEDEKTCHFCGCPVKKDWFGSKRNKLIITHVGEKTHGFNREDDSTSLYFCRYFID